MIANLFGSIIFKDGQPCNHSGCKSYVSHPCEGCGRIGAQGVFRENPFADVFGYDQFLGYRKIKLVREGFPTLMIRDKHGYWEVLEYTDRYGSERWRKVDVLKFEVEKHIQLYGKA